RLGRDDLDVAMPAILESLDDRDPTVRAAAATALVTVVPGPRGGQPPSEAVHKATTALIRTMNDPQPTVRAAASEALWMVIMVGQVPSGEPILGQAEAALIARLGDRDASSRLAAIRGLGSIGAKLADNPPPALVAALSDESEQNREAVFFALAS